MIFNKKILGIIGIIFVSAFTLSCINNIDKQESKEPKLKNETPYSLSTVKYNFDVSIEEEDEYDIGLTFYLNELSGVRGLIYWFIDDSDDDIKMSNLIKSSFSNKNITFEVLISQNQEIILEQEVQNFIFLPSGKNRYFTLVSGIKLKPDKYNVQINVLSQPQFNQELALFKSKIHLYPTYGGK